MVRIHPDPPTDTRPGIEGFPPAVLPIRGHSSAGRAPALQAGGHRFDPGWLHQDLARWRRAHREGQTFLNAFCFIRLLFNNSEETRRARLSQTAGLIWVRNCIQYWGCGSVGRDPTKRKEKPVAARRVLKIRCSPL
jgi:hypothetical protein